ncbi:hypothetical protein [Chromobacterium amazonense]|uniref:hypothetical protein n=1 Tax=Chromobacterium amazonense TaxID=1382803 RepID=UPI003F7ADA3A
MHRLFISFALIRAALSLAPAAIAADEDHPETRALIESFRVAILQRDKPRFLNLFVSPSAPWQSVWSDDGLAQIQRDHSLAIKVRYQQENNQTTFIDSIIRLETASEEAFSNIKIDSDGEVATVTFDYSFLVNRQPSNRGKECGLLARTEDGWKITTLIY